MKSINFNLIFYLATIVWIDNIAGEFVELSGRHSIPEVNTTKGTIRGEKWCVEGGPVTWFLGIPYAKPPTGDLRFQPPQEMDQWEGIKETKSPPNACPQTITKIPGFEVFTVNTNTSEDCLYLNVFLPSDLDPQARLPVMVWLHGGGFTGGSSTLEAYDGRYLALQSQAIIVTVNYRLGFLGFMRMGDVKGNMGLLDQKAALEWVQDNIEKFGGNKCDVTLFGQSAGASSVSLHLVSPLSSGLFQKAIMQSGSFLSPWSFVDVNTAEERTKEAAKNAGCAESFQKMQCLMKKPVDEIVKAQSLDNKDIKYPWWFVPTVDETFITKHPKEMLKEVINKKPILFGSTHDEGSLFTSFTLQKYLLARNFSDNKQLEELYKVFYYYPYPLIRISTPNFTSISGKYPPHKDNFLDNFNTITQALSDAWFVCPTNDFASLYKPEISYNYLFTQTLSKKLPPTFGATHGLDLLFSFSTIIKYRQRNFTENDIKLSEQIISFWSNFARNGNPNSDPKIGNYSTWPQNFQNNHKYLTLNEKFLNGDNAVVEESFRNDFCTFWSTIKSDPQTPKK